MLRILDTTLREGEQTPGVAFPLHVKPAIGAALERLGVDIVEVGHPAVDEEIARAVATLAADLTGPLVGAHARSLVGDVDQALACGVGFLGIFYCVSDGRLAHHETDLHAAVKRIAEVIQYARSRDPELVIRYTPEDTVRSPWPNVLLAATEAVRAGADVISVADTTGYMMPGGERSMYDFVSRLREGLAARGCEPTIAVHCHNDRGLALANSLDAVRAGAEIVDATVMGLGERAGLTDLGTLLAILVQDEGMTGRWDLTVLPELYALVSRYARIAVPPHWPVTGEHAFTHCAGVHTQAALRDPLHYQSLDPALVGRQTRISLDHMSGLSSLDHVLAGIGMPDLALDLRREVLAQVKRIGRQGRVVDEAELRLLVRFVAGQNGTKDRSAS